MRTEPALSNGILGSVREAWTDRYHGPGIGDDRVRDLAIDSDGNVYVTGGSFGNEQRNYFDYATIKYDPEGNPLWVARYHDVVNGGDEAVALALDAKRNVYVTGTICTEFRVVIGCVHWTFGTIKYSPEGQRLWVARYQLLGNGDAFAAAIAVSAQGEVYVTGGRFPEGQFGSDNYATIKYDTNGTQIWIAQYIGPRSYDTVRSLTLDAQGNAYVTGTSSGEEPGISEYATIKYDSDGTEVWVARYRRPGSQLNRAAALALDSVGNVHVTGTSEGAYSTIKYDPDGTEVWTAQYEAHGSAAALACDADGNVYVTGASVVDGREDYATVKYDSKGNEAWIVRYHGPGTGGDYGKRIALDSKRNVYVTGSSSGDGPHSDFATIKYDPEGTELWVARSGSGRRDSYDAPNAFALDAQGNVYVTGQSLNTTRVYEYFTVKYSQ